MLPVTLQFIIAMVAHALHERMARRVDYLQEEVRVLREALATATGKSRLSFTPEQRRRLAINGKALTPDEREACCQVVRPATLLVWFRRLAAKKYDSSKARRVGRPRKAGDIRELVLELARANPGWGYTKIRDALRGLKIEIGRTTVANALAEAGLEPAPERSRKRTWKQFLSSHWETLYACDFFAVETLGVFGTVRYLVFFVIELKSRTVQIAGIRIAPDGAWMAQVARNLLDPMDGFLRNASYLIHDRDPLFTRAWTELLESSGSFRPELRRATTTLRSARLDRMPVASRRSAQFLLSRGVVRGHDEFSDTTGAREWQRGGLHSLCLWPKLYPLALPLTLPLTSPREQSKFSTAERRAALRRW